MYKIYGSHSQKVNFRQRRKKTSDLERVQKCWDGLGTIKLGHLVRESQ